MSMLGCYFNPNKITIPMQAETKLSPFLLVSREHRMESGYNLITFNHLGHILERKASE